ncbi:MAG TPA: hypothetical protein VIM70_21720 [Clostridium sp.]|uniref:hypothetical protein n=1 Tax=Clostridium sp. TaxID=1506 RepID=UPI002F930851
MNDFAFITYIAFQAGHLTADLVIFILLPLVNALNHTHDSIRKSFSIQLYCFTIISFFITNHFKLDFYYIVPIIAISLINLSIAFRMFLSKVNNKLDTIIEGFLIEKDSPLKIYRILRVIISTINHDIFLKKIVKIKRITFFKVLKGQVPYVIISSDFIYTYEINDSKAENLGRFINEVSGSINGEVIENGMGLNLKKTAGMSNFVLIESEKSISTIYIGILIEKVFVPIFLRILRINALELEMSRLRKEYFDKSKNEFENIDAAANAIHFLANKLSPVTNYFKMVNDLNAGKINDEHVAEWHELIDSDFKRSTLNIKSIQTKMMQIAQYTSSSKIVAEFEEMKIKSFITYLRQAFLEDCIKPVSINLNSTDIPQLENSLNVNMKALDFVFIELIDNYNKHSQSAIKIELGIDAATTTLSMTLSNEIKDFQSNAKLVTDYVNDFNTGEINELLQRKGNKGIKFLKQFLQELKIEHSCETKNGIMFIFLKFKLS